MNFADFSVKTADTSRSKQIESICKEYVYRNIETFWYRKLYTKSWSNLKMFEKTTDFSRITFCYFQTKMCQYPYNKMF